MKTNDLAKNKYEAPATRCFRLASESDILTASFGVEPIGDEEYDLFTSEVPSSSFTSIL